MKRLAGLLGVATLAASMIAMGPGRSAAQDLEAAKENFKSLCVKCHGESGKGDGPKAASLSKKPADWTDCAKMSKVSDEEMFKGIKLGGPAINLSKEFPKFGDGLEDEEIKGLVSYVRTFCKK